MITSTVKSIEHLKSVDGLNLSRLQSFLPQLSDSGIVIKKPANLGEEYFRDSIKIPFLDKLTNNIKERFEDKSIMAAFDIFDPSKIPSDFALYGNDHVENIVKE